MRWTDWIGSGRDRKNKQKTEEGKRKGGIMN